MSRKKLARALRNAGFRYRYDWHSKEFFIERYRGRVFNLQGIFSAGGDYPASHPGTPYLILSDDWDRRANSEYRKLWPGKTPDEALAEGVAYFRLAWLNDQAATDWLHEF